MNTENLYPIVSTIGGGFFVGILIGYALKKMVKIVAIVVGLFFAGLAYLQYQHIVNIDWNKLHPVSQNAAITVLNASKYIPGLVPGDIRHEIRIQAFLQLLLNREQDV